VILENMTMINFVTLKERTAGWIMTICNIVAQGQVLLPPHGLMTPQEGAVNQLFTSIG